MYLSHDAIIDSVSLSNAVQYLMGGIGEDVLVSNNGNGLDPFFFEDSSTVSQAIFR